MERCAEVCGDNRFELIEKYKEKLVKATNIETAKEEMDVIDNILFRFWQMGWLDKLEADVVPRSEYDDLKMKFTELDIECNRLEKVEENYHKLESKVKNIFDEYGNYDFPTDSKENFNNTLVTNGVAVASCYPGDALKLKLNNVFGSLKFNIPDTPVPTLNYTYVFTDSDGISYKIRAKSKKDAVGIFNKKYGIPFWFIRKYFTIKKEK